VSFLDKKTIKRSYSDFRQKLSDTFYDFSLFERILVIFFAIAIVWSSFSIFIKVNDQFSFERPKDGGSLKEGLLGTPRFVNPVLATSDTDRDLTALVYSGLLRLTNNGELIPDLAESYSISDDGLTYYFKIKENAVFHDDTKITADDVIFTILKTQDPTIKSPKRPNWDGVKIEKISDTELEFVLSTPYAPFIYNTTLGVLPKHKWNEVTSEEFPFSSLNTSPIGSGPYKINSVKEDENKIITSYTLSSFEEFTLKEPYISKISVLFYKNEESILNAFNKKQIDSLHSVSPDRIKDINLKKSDLITLPYSRIFALFFNQNKSPVLTDKNVRELLNTSIDRQALIDSTLEGYATPLYSPLTLFATSTFETPDTAVATEAKKLTLLDKYNLNLETEGDDDKQKIKFTITTSNVPEFIKVGEKLVETFNALGAEVDLKISDINDITLNTIRPREFEAILFGNVINRDLDYYAFWHSSQRNDPGLNLSAYTSIESDVSLEKSRNSIDTEEKLPLLQKFEKEVINDVPAIFLYSPDFIYILPKKVTAQFPSIIVTPSDRYFEVYNWYIETERVWNIFAN